MHRKNKLLIALWFIMVKTEIEALELNRENWMPVSCHACTLGKKYSAEDPSEFCKPQRLHAGPDARISSASVLQMLGVLLIMACSAMFFILKRCKVCILLRNDVRATLKAEDKDPCEGQRCVISCKLVNQPNNRALMLDDLVHYCWYKDGTELKDCHRKELILQPLRVSDFGGYQCSLQCNQKHGRMPGAIIKSDESYDLDVLPGPTNELRRLKELSLIDERRIIIDLAEIKSADGISLWKVVAEHYEMPRDDIRVLDPKLLPNNQGPLDSAESTLEYLYTSQPSLTVYDFCKYLKEIKQNAIVEYLEDHLTSPTTKDKGQSSSHTTISLTASRSSDDEEDPSIKT